MPAIVVLNRYPARQRGSSLAPSWRQSRLVAPSPISSSLSANIDSASTEVAGNRGNALAGDTLQAIGDELESLAPVGLLQPSVAADVGPIQPAKNQAVDREAGLVRDPLFVDRFVETREHAQDL